MSLCSLLFSPFSFSPHPPTPLPSPALPSPSPSYSLSLPCPSLSASALPGGGVGAAEVAGSKVVPELPECGQSEPEPPEVEGGAEATGNELLLGARDRPGLEFRAYGGRAGHGELAPCLQSRGPKDGGTERKPAPHRELALAPFRAAGVSSLGLVMKGRRGSLAQGPSVLG